MEKVQIMGHFTVYGGYDVDLYHLHHKRKY